MQRVSPHGGVETRAELVEMGALNAYRLMLLRGVPANLNLLGGLQAAVLDRHWLELTGEEKEALKAELEKPWNPGDFIDLE